MTLDSIIDSLLLLTNACFINMLIISLIIFFFFDLGNVKKHDKNNSWKPKKFALVFPQNI